MPVKIVSKRNCETNTVILKSGANLITSVRSSGNRTVGRESREPSFDVSHFTIAEDGSDPLSAAANV